MFVVKVPSQGCSIKAPCKRLRPAVPGNLPSTLAPTSSKDSSINERHGVQSICASACARPSMFYGWIGGCLRSVIAALGHSTWGSCSPMASSSERHCSSYCGVSKNQGLAYRPQIVGLLLSRRQKKDPLETAISLRPRYSACSSAMPRLPRGMDLKAATWN